MRYNPVYCVTLAVKKVALKRISKQGIHAPPVAAWQQLNEKKKKRKEKKNILVS